MRFRSTMLAFALLLGFLSGCWPTLEQRIADIDRRTSRLEALRQQCWLRPSYGQLQLGQDHPVWARIALAREQVEFEGHRMEWALPSGDLFAVTRFREEHHARLNALERRACTALELPVRPGLGPSPAPERLGVRTDELTALQEAAALEAANPLAPGWALRPLRLDPLSLSVQDDLAAERLIEATARLWLAQADEPR